MASRPGYRADNLFPDFFRKDLEITQIKLSYIFRVLDPVQNIPTDIMIFWL